MIGGTKKLAAFLLLIVTLQVMLGTTDGWRRRRRRRRYTPPPTPKPCDSSLPSDRTWHSRWHGLFYYGCAFGYSLSYWHSRYRECQQDRIHHFQCRRPTNSGNAIQLSGTGCCDWTLRRLINNYLSKCPNNGFITSVVSDYDKRSKNRRFWMRCCWDRRYKHSNCRTVTVQSHGKVLNYKVPPNYVMTGVGQSDSSNGGHWHFKVCQLKRRKKY